MRLGPVEISFQGFNLGPFRITYHSEGRAQPVPSAKIVAGVLAGIALATLSVAIYRQVNSQRRAWRVAMHRPTDAILWAIGSTVMDGLNAVSGSLTPVQLLCISGISAGGAFVAHRQA